MDGFKFPLSDRRHPLHTAARAASRDDVRRHSTTMASCALDPSSPMAPTSPFLLPYVLLPTDLTDTLTLGFPHGWQGGGEATEEGKYKGVAGREGRPKSGGAPASPARTGGGAPGWSLFTDRPPLGTCCRPISVPRHRFEGAARSYVSAGCRCNKPCG